MLDEHPDRPDADDDLDAAREGGSSGPAGRDHGLWSGIRPAQMDLQPWQWERAGQELEHGVIPACATPSKHLRAELVFPDGTTAHVQNPLYVAGSPSQCSCGRGRCQHVATALRALAEGRTRTLWREPVSTALEARDRRARSTGDRPANTPVVTGLVIGTIDRPGTYADCGVAVRPSRRTQKGTWHQTLGWDEIRKNLDALPPEQQSVLRTLMRFRTLEAREVPLDHVGPEIWSLLESAVDVGLEVEAEGDLHLDREPVIFETRVAAAGDGLTVRAQPVWPRSRGIRRWRLLGRPVHAVLATATENTVVAPVVADLSLIALAQQGDLWVPRGDIDDFTERALPTLRDVAPVHVQRSPDHSTGELSGPPPELPDPIRLVATLTSRATQGLRVTWGWTYGGGDGDGMRHVFELAPSIDGGRRPGDELETLARLKRDIDGLERWLDRAPRDLDLVEACRFSLTVQRALSEHDLAIVLTTEDAPQFVEEEQPTIDWDIIQTDRRDWLDLSGAIRVGDERVAVSTLIHALLSGEPLLVTPAGDYLDLFTPQMAALRRLLERAAALPDEGRLRINRHDLDLLDELHDLSRLQREAEQWREGLGAVLPADLSEEPLDEGVHATLRPYQLEGYQWLSARWDVGLGGILADDMGLGKTLQLLAAIRRHRRRDERPVLVAAPRSVLSTWAQQSELFTPDLRVRVITQRLPGAVADGEPADVYVVSHHLLRLDEDVYSGVDWTAVVLDEAQAAKNPLSRLHRTVRHLRREVTFAITGTPVENSLQDVWALLALTAPGLLPSLAEFNATWRKPIEKAGDAQLLAELRTRIAPSMLRRTKELVATDLPQKSEDVLTQPLHPQAADHYSRVLNRERLRIMGLLADPDRNRVEILACLTRLRLLATDPGTVEEPSAKTAELVERLRETSATGHRALVFSQFTGHLKIVQAILEGAGITTSYLDGTTRDRERVLEEFRHGDQDAFLISLKAGGSGITLTEADYVFLLDPWWNPAVEEQAVDRTHRIGQTSPVSVYRFVASDTIEEKVLTLQDEKRRLARSVLQADGTAPALLDPARIRELLEP